MPIFLLAQETATSVTGWGAFGLAGLILSWLFLKHLPDKDVQIKGLLADQARERELDRASRHNLAAQFQVIVSESRLAENGQRDKDAARHEERMHQQSQDFKDAMATVLKHCEAENKKLTEVFRRELEQMIHGKRTKEPGS